MRFSSLIFVFLFVLISKAETILSEADVMLSKQTYEVCANLYAGTQVYVDEELADRKIKIFLKLYAKATDKRYGKLQAGSPVYDEKGKQIGKVLKNFNLIDNPDSNGLPYFIYLRAYIFSDRLDPASIPEIVLGKLSETYKGKLDTSYLNSFLNTFPLQLAEDTLGFKLFKLEEQNQTRLSLVFRDGRLVAVIPKRTIDLRFFEYKLSQENLEIYYFEKLKEEEEAWMNAYFMIK